MTKKTVDVVIIGSGLAALVAADRLSKHKNVIVITKSKKENSNSFKAQGGVSVVIARNDHWMNHFEDTITAGNQHNIEENVQILVQKGPEYLQMMINDGMPFDRDQNGKLVLGQEGAHRMRRILHAGGDATGKVLIEFMLNRLQSSTVTIIEDVMAVDLIVSENKCFGVKVKTNTGTVERLYAKDTILAAGGCGGLYSFSSNDSSITGDGLAMAYRAGANLVDLEFVQFHPTMLFVKGVARGLISEAVRGEGAIIVTKDGRQLMDGVHPQMDLAPRDVVSRAINQAVLNGEQVFLDISMIKDFETRFPTITKLCQQNGIDLNQGKIPVVPGAHFHMGGVEVSQQGQTSIEHLYAIGEVSYTGVHGANRLASNSLLEGIVFANELADHLLSQKTKAFEVPNIIENKKIETIVLPTKEEIQEIMMKYVGIVRDEQGMQYAKKWFEQFLSNNETATPAQLTNDEIVLYNMITAGWLITTSALMREESRGGHYRSDFVTERADWTKKQLVRNCLIPTPLF